MDNQHAKSSCTVSPLSRHSSISPDNGPTLYIFLPYLHFDTYRALLRRRALISKRLRQGRARPVPQAVARLESPELQVIWEYLGHDPPVNCRRTLDQYGYPSLHDTRPRDDDQMLYKMTKERIVEEEDLLVVEPSRKKRKQGRAPTAALSGGQSEQDGGHAEVQGNELFTDTGSDEETDDKDLDDAREALNGNVLMVDQLWMWAIGRSKCSYHAKQPHPGMGFAKG
jgi:hypothetical protein